MRVLHVIPGIAPRYGGPSTALGPMCAALNRLPGVTAEIATTDADGSRGRLPADCIPAGVVTHVFRRTCSEQWKFSFDLRRWLRRHARDYDVIHTHALWSFAPGAAAAAALKAGAPYIVRPAGMLSKYTWARGAWKKRLAWRLSERRTVFGAAAFHATSSEEAAEIEAVRPGAKVFIIPQAVEAAAWQAPANPDLLRRRCGPAAGDRPILLFLSRLHPKKGVADLLLPAFVRLKGGAFLAIAGGPDSHAAGYEAEVRETIDRLGLGGRVAVLGPVSADERWAFFDGAALFVLPSHSENFGIVVAEAMARGCPAVVSDAVQSAEHVTAARAGRVAPLRVDALAAALDESLGDLAACRAMGERGRQYVRDNLTWEQVAVAVARMYRECLAGTG